jgi:DNA-binding MarR family transcriptional regulator
VTDPAGLTSEQARTWRTFLAMSNQLEASLNRDLMREAGMPHSYFGVLATLSRHPDGRCRLTDLASDVNFSQSRLAHAVTKMESQGWLRREPRQGSKLEKDAVLTAAGREALDTVLPRHVDLVRRMIFDRITPAQTRQLATICQAILDGLADADPA